MTWRTWIAATLLGVSASTPPPAGAPSLGDATVKRARSRAGGQLATLPTTRTRWYMADLEAAQYAADGGRLALAAQLCSAMRRDATKAGLMSTRTGGLVRLPKRFRGRADMVQDLSGVGAEETCSVFEEMFPSSELELLDQDGIELGVGVAELVPVEGRDFPVMVRLPPEFLEFRWSENRWYYNSIAGPIPITPGDGRWILHIPGGRYAPWLHGLWHALGESWISKVHAQLHLANWEAKLANPARVAVAPQGATDEQKQSWFRRVMAWGINTVFGMTPGYDVKLLESNGRGYESFGLTIERSDRSYAIAIAGQVVTVDGGTGFSNQDVHKAIRADLIKRDAEALAYTLNTQGIPPWVLARYGEAALAERPIMAWDVTEPHDLASEAATLTQVAGAITALSTALQPFGRTLDITTIATRFAVPIAGDQDGDGRPDVEIEVEAFDAAVEALEAENDNGIDVEFEDEPDQEAA
jgi:hypothetical protein